MIVSLFRIVRASGFQNKMHGDARVYAFEDINPQTPTHMLILPKTHIAGLRAAKPNGR